MKFNFFKKLISRFAVTVLVCGLLISQISFTKIGLVSAAETEPEFTFGIISDIHFTKREQPNEDTNLRKALTKFKENNIKVLLVAGDIANGGEKESYEKFNRIFKEIYPDNLTAPKKVLVMGNHDYWNGLSNEDAQKLFEDTLGTTINSHIVVDGYHFIGVSTEDGYIHGVFSDNTKKWLKQQLEQAEKDDPQKPIFVTFHQHIKDTVYLSDTWGNDALDEVLKNYPQAITFSGHSHAVLDDERSIYQKDYTCVGTSTLSYTELEPGRVGGTVPVCASEVAQGILGKITDTSVNLERCDFHNDCKIKSDWVIDLPIDKAKFRYTDARIDERVAPIFDEGAKISASKIESSTFKLTFDQAKHPDFVHSYRIQSVNTETKETERDSLFFTNFYRGLQKMKAEPSYRVSGLKPGTTYDVNVYAIESFGKQSKPITLSVKTLEDDSTTASATDTDNTTAISQNDTNASTDKFTVTNSTVKSEQESNPKTGIEVSAVVSVLVIVSIFLFVIELMLKKKADN